MGFLGQYEHTLDAKNRLTIPVRFRAPLSNGVVLVRSFDPCVSIYTPEGWESFTSQWLRARDPLDPEVRRVQRFINSGTFEGKLDGAGRIMLPPPLIKHAGLDRDRKHDVLVVGNDDSIEVWQPEAWERYQSEADIVESARGLARNGV